MKAIIQKRMNQREWREPDINKFYEANQLRALASYQNGISEKSWVSMEANGKVLELIGKTVSGDKKVIDIK